MAISMYNHNAVDSEEKPLITNLHFKLICEDIKAGRPFNLTTLQQRLSLVQAQLIVIERLIKENKHKQPL